jgi:hypothetical protein
MAGAVVGGLASAAATGLGLGIGSKDLALTNELFKLQMRQTKRLWAADWSEASWRHGEQVMQSAQQHAEAQAMAAAAYFQAEKIHRREYQLAADQEERNFEMAWRAEAREALRDELVNQNSRFNNVMLCDTVCLGCAFGMVVEGEPPLSSSHVLLVLYMLCLGLSICLFTLSLWAAVIVVRRLNEHTASVLERKLFFSSDELQALWQQQLDGGKPTGVDVMQKLAEAYEVWLDYNCEPLATRSTMLLSWGVVSLFVTAGTLTHAKYRLRVISMATGILS